MRSHFLLFALTACGTSTPSEPDHVDLVSDPYTLQPGDEKYFCYTTNLPMDRDVALTKFTPTYGDGTHHILFSQTLVAEPDGFSECNVLTRDTWVPLYAGGKNSGPLELPENTGFKPLGRGQQLLMQLHLQNASDQPITATTSMRIDLVDLTPDIVPAGIYGLDDRKLDIPAHTSAAMNQMSCTIDRDLDVFAVMGHMHKHGVSLDLSRGATAGTEMLFQENWSFDLQPVTPTTFHVAKSDNLWLSCTHDNETDAPIAWGESSDTEMCAFIMYYAPSIGLDGCINQ
jgi:hypothetical protein